MKTLVFGFLCAFTAFARADEMPALNLINEITLTAPYSCGGSYDQSALFLSNFSKSRNRPDLLYNGACAATDYVQASTAGDDFSLISDLGDVPLERVTASKALNWQPTTGKDNAFMETKNILPNHTYSVLILKSEIRALYVFRVISHKQDGPLTIKYAVKFYSIKRTASRSSGFDWETGNREVAPASDKGDLK